MNNYWFGTQRALVTGQAGFVIPDGNTMDAVKFALEDGPEPAGTRAALLDPTGLLIAGIWTSDGAGASACPDIDWTLVDATMVTSGDADTFNVEVDTGASISFASGLVPLATVATKIVYHGLGVCPPDAGGTFWSKTAQTATPGTLVDGVFLAGGFYMPRAGFGSLIVAGALHYTGGLWRPRVGFGAWPGPAFSGGVSITMDASGELSVKRSPRGDGTLIQSGALADYIGATIGANAGTAPYLGAVTDAWSQANRLCIPANFYDPKTSDFAVVIKDTRTDHG